MGKDILEHFYNIGEEQCKPYRDLIEKIVDCKIPKLPEVYIFVVIKVYLIFYISKYFNFRNGY